MRKISIFLSVAALFTAGPVLAHVTVKPAEVGIGAFQTYNVSVPSEKDVATTGLRLVLPAGLSSVSPTVKAGWTGRTVANDQAAGGITEISWTGGSIPPHFRDDFTFSAKAPATPTDLVWKAYQTYADGSVVAWELGPNDVQPKKADGSNDYSASGPASVTQVVDDLTAVPETEEEDDKRPSVEFGIPLSVISLVIALVALHKATNRPTV